MKVCPDNSIGLVFDQRKQTANLIFGIKYLRDKDEKECTAWCGSKLPCGKCIGVRIYMACGMTPIDRELPCETCKARFICHTDAGNYKYPESLKQQKLIIKTLGIDEKIVENAKKLLKKK